MSGASQIANAASGITASSTAKAETSEAEEEAQHYWTQGLYPSRVALVCYGNVGHGWMSVVESSVGLQAFRCTD